MTHEERRREHPTGTRAGILLPASGWRWISITAIALALVAFALDVSIAHRLANLGAVDQFDVFFHADTAARIECMVQNECGGRSAFSHPNLAAFLNPPVRATAWGLKHTVLTEWSEEEIRRTLSLSISPLASALKAPSVFFLFLLLGLSVVQAGLLALLNLVTFSQLVFGSIPEAFALSGLLIALMYLLAVCSMRTRDRGLWPWVAIGFLATGITVTNLVMVLILFVAARLHHGAARRSVILQTALLVVVIVIPTALVAQLTKDHYGLKGVSLEGGLAYVDSAMKTRDVVHRALETPAAWANTIAAPTPRLVVNTRAIREGSRYRLRFSLSSPGVYPAGNALTVLLLLLLVAGSICYRNAPRVARWVGAASLAIMAFNGALHSVWGDEPFLYSQHWQLSLLVLLSGPLFMQKPGIRRLAGYALAGLLLAVMAQNGATGFEMLERLESFRP